MPSTLISVERTGKSHLDVGQPSTGDTPVLSYYSLIRNPFQNQMVCWSIVVKEKPMLVLHFGGHFLLTASLRHQRMSMYISLFTGAIPVNYTREFK
jgi:hypothetical protein